MKTKKPKAELVCKQFEDLLAPRLHLSAVERAVYSHLFRHTRLEGKSSLRFSMRWLARNLCLGQNSVRRALRRLVRKGVLRHTTPRRASVPPRTSSAGSTAKAA